MKEYQKPTLKVVEFETEVIIQTSGVGDPLPPSIPDEMPLEG